MTDGCTHSWWPYDPTKGGSGHIEKSACALYRGSDLRRGFDLLREAIYRNDAQAIQDAWPNCERWLDFVFAEAKAALATRFEPRS